MSNPALFIALLIVLALWVFTQIFKKNEVRDELKKINEKFDTLISEVRHDRSERKQKDNYDG